MQGRKPAGRPTTPGREGEKATLGIRASASLKKQLVDATKVSGRSLSAEAEFRLEQSFASDVPPRLRAIGQDWMIAFAHFGMQAAQDAGSRGAVLLLDWLDDPDCFRRALAGASHFVVQAGHAPSVSVEYRLSLAKALQECAEAFIESEERRATQ